MRKHIKWWTSAVLFGLSGSVFAHSEYTSVLACKTVSECQSEISSAEQKRKQLETEIASKKSEVSELQAEVENILKQIATYNTQIESAQKTINLLAEQSEALVKSMDETEQLLKTRLIDTQLSFETNQNLNFIADSTSVTEMIERSQAIASLTENDQELVKKYDFQNKQVLKNKEETETKKQELETYKAEQEKLQSEKQTKIDEYRQKISLLEAEENQVSVSQELSETQLKDIQAALNRVPVTTTPGLSANSGLRPLKSGWITAEYGETRYHSVAHNGTDYAPLGDPTVYSMVDGVVVANLYNSARGYLVAIAFNDGSGYKTLMYQHLASAGVPIGSVVSKGQAVGRAGNTGQSTGLHLHSEVGDAKMVGGSPTWVDRGAAAGPGLYSTEQYFGIPNTW